ncbi:MAG TPA: VOC family protein [Euzebyales bacterium]|nr:VOC family protein [Euzebyales bacterium]
MQVLAARVLLRPTDIDAAVDFYEHRVGLVRFREWGAPPHRGIVYFLGGGYLELTETPPDQPRPPRPDGVRVWLQVADATRACRELQRRGVEIDAAPERKPWGLIEATIHDPDGLPLVIVETPLDHPLRRRD